MILKFNLEIPIEVKDLMTTLNKLLGLMADFEEGLEGELEEAIEMRITK